MNIFRKKKVVSFKTDKSSLLKCLSAFDLIFLGIGAIIGAGIFVLTGIVAATEAGPGIVLCYIFAGLACAFAALSYAELAAMIGGCGSAYGYAYAGFGEIIAWIVGWDLLLEYAISVSAVAVGWSSYFNDFLVSINVHLPPLLLHGPFEGGLINFSAVGIVITLASLLIIGIKTSAYFNNVMVFIKLSVICLFIFIATREVNPHNWSPFLPYGFTGIMRGSSLIFFAYVGFDAISTATEEALNPQRDIPIGIIGALVISTLLYILVSGLLCGIISYRQLNVTSPITHALLVLGYKSAAGLVGVGAITGLTTVMLVLFFGLSRIFFAMARDGLLPKFFSKTHQTTKAPIRIIIISGIFMCLISGLIPLRGLAELVNIGTLFAFMIVCLGVIVLRYTQPNLNRPFKAPGMPYTPILGLICCSYLIYYLPVLTWFRFLIWMLLGLLIYFTYGVKNSVLGNHPDN